MLAYQGGRTLFIQEEYGRVPTRTEFITTTSFVVHSRTAVALNIPIQHIDIQGLQDEEFQSPLYETEVFEKTMETYHQTLWALTADDRV